MANKFHDFDEPINRIGTDSFKWDYEGENGKYIPLGIADTDFKAPEEAIAAVRKRTEFGVYAYGALPQERFAASICNWYKKRYGLTCCPGNNPSFTGTHDRCFMDDPECIYPSGR